MSSTGKTYKHGLVAYFDILGFTHVAEAETDGEIAQAAELIVKHLTPISERIRARFPRQEYLMERLDWRVFADSILLCHEVPPEDFDVYHWHNFFRICAELMQTMFSDGLALRGAISAGSFFVTDHCFVGKPITDCHKLAAQTEWSGCVVTPQAKKVLEALWVDAEWKTIMEQVTVEYDVSFKAAAHSETRSARRERLLVIKWAPFNLWHAPDSVRSEIPTLVRTSFEAHGKTVDGDVEAKMVNTKSFCEFVDTLYANSNEPRKRRSWRKRSSNSS